MFSTKYKFQLNTVNESLKIINFSCAFCPFRYFHSFLFPYVRGDFKLTRQKILMLFHWLDLPFNFSIYNKLLIVESKQSFLIVIKKIKYFSLQSKMNQFINRSTKIIKLIDKDILKKKQFQRQKPNY